MHLDVYTETGRELLGLYPGLSGSAVGRKLPGCVPAAMRGGHLEGLALKFRG